MTTETLHELVARRLGELGTPGKPMSVRQATERARGAVSYEIVRQIANGTHSGNITDRTAEGLARALDVSTDSIYKAARVLRPVTRWAWPERFDRLDAGQRRLVEDLAGALLDAYDKGKRAAVDA
jgi:hypothetical protein